MLQKSKLQERQSNLQCTYQQTWISHLHPRQESRNFVIFEIGTGRGFGWSMNWPVNQCESQKLLKYNRDLWIIYSLWRVILQQFTPWIEISIEKTDVMSWKLDSPIQVPVNCLSRWFKIGLFPLLYNVTESIVMFCTWPCLTSVTSVTHLVTDIN